MNRNISGTILWACMAAAMGTGLYFIKQGVKDMEGRLAGVNRDIARNQDEIHVLNAEWSFLNDPGRLRDLAERHLGMKVMAPSQVATLDNLGAPHGTAYAMAHQPAVHVAVAQPVVPTPVHTTPVHTAPVPAAPVAIASAAPVSAAPPHHHAVTGTGLAMVTSTEAR